jgi:hypothetical protein
LPTRDRVALDDPAQGEYILIHRRILLSAGTGDPNERGESSP